MENKKTLDVNYECSYYYDADHEEPEFNGNIKIRTNSKDDYELIRKMINHQQELRRKLRIEELIRKDGYLTGIIRTKRSSSSL